MEFAMTYASNFRSSLFVTTLRASVGSILSFMGLDHVLFEFLTYAAVGAATGLLVILAAGVGIPSRHPAEIRHHDR